MEKLSVVIITKNNESIIQKCLESVKWADEIVVVDSGSVDKTLTICKDYGCKIIESDWLGFGNTKILAVNNASHNWIFSIDSDEVCSNKLQKQIIIAITNESISGYNIKRRTFYLEHPIRFCGWQRDYPLRLFRKDKGNFNNRNIHEFVEVQGRIATIHELIYHYSFPTISSHITKIETYSTLGALESFKKGKRNSLITALLKGYFKFFKMYIIQLGFLDGITGLILCKNSAFGVYLKYLKVLEFHLKNK